MSLDLEQEARLLGVFPDSEKLGSLPLERPRSHKDVDDDLECELYPLRGSPVLEIDRDTVPERQHASGERRCVATTDLCQRLEERLDHYRRCIEESLSLSEHRIVGAVVNGFDQQKQLLERVQPRLGRLSPGGRTLRGSSSALLRSSSSLAPSLEVELSPTAPSPPGLVEWDPSSNPEVDGSGSPPVRGASLEEVISPSNPGKLTVTSAWAEGQSRTMDGVTPRRTLLKAKENTCAGIDPSKFVGNSGSHGTSQWRSLIQMRTHQEKTRRSRKKLISLTREVITAHAREAQAQRQTLLFRVIHSLYFEILSVMLTLANAIFIGVQASALLALSMIPGDQPLDAESSSRLPDFKVVSTIFCVLFLVELLLRLAAEGFGFFLGVDRFWNLFDSVVVGTNVVELIIQLSDDKDSGGAIAKWTVLRVLRLLRGVRVLRVIRNFAFFKELRTMLAAMVASPRHLIWVFIVVALWIYVNAVTLLNGVAELCSKSQDCVTEYPAITARFANLLVAMWTLFMHMYGQMDISAVFVDLLPLDTSYLLVYTIFVFVSAIVVVNVVTGLFVEMTVAATSNDRESIIQDQREQTEQYLDGMTAMFHEIDTNNSGSISLQEFQERLHDERALAYFAALKLDLSEVSTLFKLLDADNSGTVDLEEFLLGCRRLSGESRAMDVAVMKLQLQWLTNFMINFAESLEDRLEVGGAVYSADKALSDGGCQ